MWGQCVTLKLYSKNIIDICCNGGRWSQKVCLFPDCLYLLETPWIKEQNIPQQGELKWTMDSQFHIIQFKSHNFHSFCFNMKWPRDNSCSNSNNQKHWSHATTLPCAPLLAKLCYSEPWIKLCTKWGLLFGRKWYDQLHTHQGSLCTSCLGSCILIHIQKPFTVHYKLTKSLLLPILDGHVTFIKREEYKASPDYNDTNSSRN